jgi:hypothetical protein
MDRQGETAHQREDDVMSVRMRITFDPDAAETAENTLDLLRGFVVKIQPLVAIGTCTGPLEEDPNEGATSDLYLVLDVIGATRMLVQRWVRKKCVGVPFEINPWGKSIEVP